MPTVHVGRDGRGGESNVKWRQKWRIKEKEVIGTMKAI